MESWREREQSEAAKAAHMASDAASRIAAGEDIAGIETCALDALSAMVEHELQDRDIATRFPEDVGQIPF